MRDETTTAIVGAPQTRHLPHPPTLGRWRVCGWFLACALIWAAALPGSGLAQGYGGLSDPGEGFALPDPDAVLTFPKDHGAHPEFRIEWWYVTANLEGPDGTPYGVQWTLFRQALAPGPQREGWARQQFWMAHSAVTGANFHYHAETFARGGIGQAGVEAVPFRAWIDDWHMASLSDDPEAGIGDVEMTARGNAFSYRLRLTTGAAPVLQGDRGYSLKSEAGQASHYVSQPFFAVEGSITVEDREIPVTGRAWLDREWSSQYLAADQEGWDWISLHLDTGDKLMMFRLRQGDGDHYFTGNWITAEGRSKVLRPGSLRMEPLAWTDIGERRLPTSWAIQVPGHDLAIETVPLNPQAWMGTTFGYWEGPVTAIGSHAAIGYLEMTGY